MNTPDAVVSGFQNTARALRSTAERFPQSSTVRGVVSGAADGFDSTARYFRERQTNEMLDDVRSRAKDNPEACLLFALAVGFFAGRILGRR